MQFPTESAGELRPGIRYSDSERHRRSTGRSDAPRQPPHEQQQDERRSQPGLIVFDINRPGNRSRVGIVSVEGTAACAGTKQEKQYCQKPAAVAGESKTRYLGTTAGSFQRLHAYNTRRCKNPLAAQEFRDAAGARHAPMLIGNELHALVTESSNGEKQFLIRCAPN